MARQVAASAVALLLLAGCRHSAARVAAPSTAEAPSDAASEGRASLGRVLAELGCIPTCETTEGTVDASEVARAAVSQGVRKIRGRFDFGSAACTEMSCKDACCNGCSGFWVLAGGSSKGRHQLVLFPRHKKRPNRWGGLDCGVPFMRQNLPAIDLIVTGTIQPPLTTGKKDWPGYGQPTLRYTSICLIRDQKDGEFPAPCSGGSS
jgi:hypothetical protein